MAFTADFLLQILSKKTLDIPQDKRPVLLVPIAQNVVCHVLRFTHILQHQVPAVTPSLATVLRSPPVGKWDPVLCLRTGKGTFGLMILGYLPSKDGDTYSSELVINID